MSCVRPVVYAYAYIFIQMWTNFKPRGWESDLIGFQWWWWEYYVCACVYESRICFLKAVLWWNNKKKCVLWVITVIKSKITEQK